MFDLVQGSVKISGCVVRSGLPCMPKQPLPLPALQVLFHIQGCGQTSFGITWGNGFVTDYGLIQNFRLDDPNPFFRALLTKPYKNRVGHARGPC
jgi:hypothetical protein